MVASWLAEIHLPLVPSAIVCFIWYVAVLLSDNRVLKLSRQIMGVILAI